MKGLQEFLTKQGLEQAIIELAWKDEVFKAQLLQDPKKALKDFLNLDVGERKNKLVEEDQNEMVIRLPQLPEGTSDELTDEELDVVAGAGNGYMVNTFMQCGSTEDYAYTCNLSGLPGCGSGKPAGYPW